MYYSEINFCALAVGLAWRVIRNCNGEGWLFRGLGTEPPAREDFAFFLLFAFTNYGLNNVSLPRYRYGT